MFGGMAVLTLLSDSQVVPIHWIIGALVLALQPQPALLGMVAVIWGLSLLGLLPELNAVFAIDPAGSLLDFETIESLALAIVRIILMLMAWNQLLFYRMLYGAPSPDKALPGIPEVIENKTGRIALWAQGSLITGALVLMIALSIGRPRPLLSTAFGLASLATGLGVGVVFSPTQRRGSVLITVTLAGLLFILTVVSSRGVVP
jgi:hypothetical protein